MEKEKELIKTFDEIQSDPPKFSEERYFRLEEVVMIVVALLEKGKGIKRHDTGDFLHYIEFGEWK